MGNMPILKDLIVDMDAVHWKKIQRVTPWLINQEPIPEREYVVPRDAMIDVTQSMACIQCGACVSDCLSMEVDPLFIGPAALAKAYRFVGDPRDAEQFDRLKDLAEDPHGMYDCTHCFKCIEACPKGVAPMSQIMRLRRRAGDDHGIDDANNGHRHEMAFVKNIRRNGLLHEADLLPDSYGGKFHPRAVPELLDSLPVITRALLRRKVTPEGRAGPLAQGPEGRQGDLRGGRGPRGPRRAQPLPHRLRRGPRRRPARRPTRRWPRRGRRRPERPRSGEPGRAPRSPPPDEGRLLARLRLARLHPGAARLDGEDRPAAGPRARRARPRELLRRRRHRRAQPGAGRHAERADLRAGAGRARRRADDEHLLDLPGRPDRVPGAPGRQRRLPRADQRDAAGGVGAVLRARPDEQELPLAARGGARPRRPDARGSGVR